MSTIAYEPHRFRTAAQYYVRGRLNYPRELIELVAQRVRLGRHDRVLDLGCGPGFLAVAFTEHSDDVLGIDPEPAMLEEADAYARERRARVAFHLGSSYQLDDALGPVRLVAMGRSFHWMDRSETLRRLDRIVDRDGAVVLFGDSHPEVAANRWKKSFSSVLEPYAQKDPAHAARKGENSNWVKHEEILLASPFRRLQRISVIQELNTPVESLVARALSMSTTSPQRLGDEQETLVKALRAVIDREAANGVVHEVVESEALLAFRP